MKRLLLLLFLGLLLFTATQTFGIEKMYTDDKGFRHYSCGVDMRGAHIAIKDIGRERYRVKSSVYAGILELSSGNRWCKGILGAVRVLCGFCKDPNTEGYVQDKIKQLGLNSAE